MIFIYRMFRAKADWTLTHTSHKDTEQSTIEVSIKLDGVTLTDPLIRWSSNEWPSVCREIPVSANKVFWTSNKSAKWTLYIHYFPFGSTAQFWALVASMKLSVSFRLLDLGQSVVLLGRVISSSQTSATCSGWLWWSRNWWNERNSI
jgi:hypothetical protein